MSADARDDKEQGPEGCYLLYESNSGGQLVLHYSKGIVPDNAVGFFLCGEGNKIQDFKFNGGGRSVLIKGIAGGDANRRKYFGGWSQFLKLAKAKKGKIIQFSPQQGVPVDIYGFVSAKSQPELIPSTARLVDISEYDAVAVMPRHAVFLEGVKRIGVSVFLEKGNIAGASTTL